MLPSFQSQGDREIKRRRYKVVGASNLNGHREKRQFPCSLRSSGEAKLPSNIVVGRLLYDQCMAQRGQEDERPVASAAASSTNFLGSGFSFRIQSKRASTWWMKVSTPVFWCFSCWRPETWCGRECLDCLLIENRYMKGEDRSLCAYDCFQFLCHINKWQIRVGIVKDAASAKVDFDTLTWGT